MSTRMSIRLWPLLLGILTLAACQEAPAPTATATAAGSAGLSAQASAERSRERVDCPTWFRETRAAVLGTLRGTEHVALIQLATAVSASTHGGGASGEVLVPTSVCGHFGRSLQRKRQPDSRRAGPRAPACTAMVDTIDQRCLQPLEHRGVALNAACNHALIGLSGSAEDLDQRMADGAFCSGFTLP